MILQGFQSSGKDKRLLKPLIFGPLKNTKVLDAFCWRFSALIGGIIHGQYCTISLSYESSINAYHKSMVDNDMAIFCNKCGTQAINDQSVYCNKCGTKLIRNIPEKKDIVCPKCRNKILDKQSVFCDKCGYQLLAISSVRVQQVDERPLVTRPVIKKKSCPKCGASLPDEYRYYCNSCGAYLHAH